MNERLYFFFHLTYVQNKRIGSGNAKRNGRHFAAAESAILEEDFDENPTGTKEKKTLNKEDSIQEQISQDETQARLMSDDYREPSKSICPSDYGLIYLVFIMSLVFQCRVHC